MSENLENNNDKELQTNEKVENANQSKIENKEETQKIVNDKKKSKMKTRTLIVLIVLVIFILGSLIMYRANYLETLEIGEQYIDVFSQNLRYKLYIGVINFIFIFAIVYMTNRRIKKGLKSFFDEEKKEMPKLPNKSLALIIALVTSLIVSSMFLQKTIWFVNSAQFGMPDPIFNMDVGFYIFSAPLIGQLLYYGGTLTILLAIYTALYYIITFNTYFEGINRQTLKNSKFIKQLLGYAMLIAIFISGIIFFNVQNMGTDGFLSLDNKMETTIIGAGAVDRNKIMGI